MIKFQIEVTDPRDYILEYKNFTSDTKSLDEMMEYLKVQIMRQHNQKIIIRKF